METKLIFTLTKIKVGLKNSLFTTFHARNESLCYRFWFWSYEGSFIPIVFNDGILILLKKVERKYGKYLKNKYFLS